jgi:hypothetical protein
MSKFSLGHLEHSSANLGRDLKLDAGFNACLAEQRAVSDLTLVPNENSEVGISLNQAVETGNSIFEAFLKARSGVRLFARAKPQGRNIFISERGHCGVGPPGTNQPGSIPLRFKWEISSPSSQRRELRSS